MQIFPKKIFQARVVESILVARGVRKISLQIAEPFSFIPGQYVWVEIPRLKIPDPEGNKKAFSVCSAANSQNIISVVARESRSGFKQAWFTLSPGDSITVHGPFGSSFVVDYHHKPNIIMIAGGVGVAPFLSVLQTIKNQSLPIKCELIYLNRDEQSTAFLRELENLKNSGDFLNYFTVYEHFSWRHVKDCYAKLNGSTEWWVVGPGGMVNHVYKELQTGGVDRDDMVFESSYPDAVNNLNFQKIRDQMPKEGLLTQAIQNSTNHTVITDANGVVLFANKAAEKITGYSQSEILGNTPRLWGGMMQPDFYKNFWEKKRSGHSFEGEIINRRKNGELYYAIAHIAPIFGDKNEIIGFIGTEEDISQLKKQEEKIMQDKLKDEAILSSMGEGVIATDKQGVVLFVNKSALEIFGKSSGEVVGKKIVDTIVLVDEKGGLIVGDDRPMNKAINTGNRVEATNCLYRNKQNQDIPIAITANPIIMDGEMIGTIEIVRDITKEKEVDKAKTEFVSLASHQLRTPLSAINWYAEMLLAGDAGKLNDEQKKYLKEVYAGNQRMVDLVNALLNVSRLDLGTFMIEPEAVSVAEIAESVLKELGPLISQKNITVTKEFEPNLPSFLADAKLLRMVIQNLLSNAVKYSSDKGSVATEVRVVKKNGIFGNKKVGVDSLGISVRDKGMGVPLRQQDKIFSKLFRADNAMETETEGTGLGLYIVKSIIDQSGGEIWFVSKQDEGTEFYVVFPLSGMKGKEGSKKLD